MYHFVNVRAHNNVLKQYFHRHTENYNLRNTDSKTTDKKFTKWYIWLVNSISTKLD